MDKNQNLPKELIEIISGVMKFIEKSESDFISDKTAQNKPEKDFSKKSTDDL